jgi:hypothetical protein
MLHRISRERVRYIAAGLAAATALLYFLIGLGVVRVVESSAATPDLFEFGAMAGGAFAFGALLLAVTDRRELWVVGALLQMVVLIGYVSAADMRTPAFEFWGLAIKAFQLLLLGALTYLALRPVQRGAIRRLVGRPLTR